MWKKTHDLMQRVCESMEIIIAVIVAFVLIVVMAFWMPDAINTIVEEGTVESLMAFMEQIMHFVVAIEFIKLMCRPSTENMIEVLVFLIARHMIIGTSGVKDLFLSVVAIVLLIITKKLTRLPIFQKRNEQREQSEQDESDVDEE